MELYKKLACPAPGIHVIAVSGGVDSVVLLHLLAQSHPSQLNLVVAHVDHGWRVDSKKDVQLVRQLAKGYGLTIETCTLRLKGKSEAEARKARYEYFEFVRQKHHANAIITAHHLDDRIETAVFNLLRGSNIYGMASLRSTAKVIRPMLEISKQEIVEYARNKGLKWREDSSNLNMQYSRNRIRHQLLPSLRKKNPNFEAEFTSIINQAQELNDEIVGMVSKVILEHGEVTKDSVVMSAGLARQVQLPVLRHVLIIASRMVKPGIQLESAAIEQAALHLKTGRVKRLRKLNNQLNLSVQGDKVSIIANE